MKPHTDTIEVRHNEPAHRFEAEVEGKLSVADYVLRGGEMIMTHTFTPPEVRGRGIAEKIVRAALEYARQQQLRVVPACSYVDIFIQRHPEFQSLVS